MIARLSPFFPAMLVFVGALCVAAGGFWASWRQSNFNIDIREKNDEIARLQRESANGITGGDSFAWADFQVFGADGGAVNAYTMPDELLLVPIIIHQGQYPLYDVAVRFTAQARGKAYDISGSLRSYAVGNMAAGFAMSTSIRLPHHGKDLEFNIYFTARNGAWIQFLRKRWVGDGWATVTKVMRGAQELYREVSANFPRRQDGS